jgi:hypothetical protein
MLPSEPSGICCRVDHGAPASGWIGSSIVRPQVCWAKPDPGTMSVRACGSCFASQSAAWLQCAGTADQPGPGRNMNSQAGAAAAISSAATTGAAGSLRRRMPNKWLAA